MTTLPTPKPLRIGRIDRRRCWSQILWWRNQGRRSMDARLPRAVGYNPPPVESVNRPKPTPPPPAAPQGHDPVARPRHYTSSPSGIECIEVTQHMGFLIGSATKYLWRAGQKGDAIEDLRKAQVMIGREIRRRQGNGHGDSNRRDL
jgi:hypothetical protein